MAEVPQDQTEPAPEAPHSWTGRLYQTVPISPIWMGVGIVVGLLLVFVAIAWAFGGIAIVRAGEEGLWKYREARLAVLVALLAGYLPTARRYVVLGAQKNLEDLLPLLGSAPQDSDSVRRSFVFLEPRAVRTAGFLGFLILPFTALMVDRDPMLYLQREYYGAEQVFAWVVGAWVGWSLGGFLYATLAYARRFSDLAGQIERIDFLDLQALAPFARQGLRSALLWLVLLSLLTLNVVDLVWFSTIAAIGLVGGTAALMLPVRGIHLRMRQAKQAELQRVHAAIRGDPGGLSGSLIGEHATSLRLSDLFAYRSFLESVREWPFDAPSMLRFALYLAIPLGSWLGGAFVERLLGAALDR
jgi:hypothetical protein